MEFFHGHSATYDIHTSHFSRAELLLIEPTDIQRYLAPQAHNDPCYNINPPVLHRPIFCRATNLESIKKALSFCMPHRTVPWCDSQGNSTKSAKVNSIIKEVHKFEVRGEGCPSSSRRPLRENKFVKSLQLLRAQPGFDCKHKCPSLQLWQHTLVGGLDDCAHFEVDYLRGHAQFEFALNTKVRWSKNIMEEHRCPDQVCTCVFLLFSSPICVHFLTQILFYAFAHRDVFGSMDSETCALLHMGVHMEEHLCLHPGAKCLFTPDTDANAPDRLKSNHRKNLDCHVLHVKEFQELCDEAEELGLGAHSWCKGAANEARRQGALGDEIESCGRWKP